MGVFRAAELTWAEVDGLDRDRLVAVLPVGAVEAHGPHLPLLTDVIIAEAMAEAGARRLQVAGWVPLLLPPVAYTAAPFAAGFAGTLSVRPETVTALVVDLARALSALPARVLVLANAHLDPAHRASLAAAVAQAASERLLPIVFPDVTRKPWAGRLGDEFSSGACHAGRYEGSIVLAARPELVREELARTLPPNPASLVSAIREGRQSFLEAGGPRAYFGDPAAASREEGQARIEALGEILAEAVVSALASGGKA